MASAHEPERAETRLPDPPRSLREEQKLFTRRRLVDAAVDVFSAGGYAAATIEDIATAAGASRATFYLHFKSKADIVTELLLKDLADDSNAIYDRLDELTGPSWDDLREWLARTITFWERHRVAIRIVDQAIGVDPALAELMGTRVLATVDRIAAYLGKKPGHTGQSARLQAMLLLAQLDRFSFFWFLTGVELDRDEVLDELTDAWWAALHPRRVRDRGAAAAPAALD